MSTLEQRKFLHKAPVSQRRSAGFSMFELVVFIIAVAIIYATAANRFAEFPGQAERANFLAISTQLQSAINLEMMLGVGVGRIGSARKLEGINPMELLLEPPVNYIGAFSAVDTARMERRVWYFDNLRRELVYLVNDSSNVFLIINGVEIPTDEIRYKVFADYRVFDSQSGLPVTALESNGNEISEQNREQRLSGILMRPVTPFRWGQAVPNTQMLESLQVTTG